MTGVHDPGGGIERDEAAFTVVKLVETMVPWLVATKPEKKSVIPMKTGQRRQVDETVRSVRVELDFPLHLLVDAAQVHLPACQRLDIQTDQMN